MNILEATRGNATVLGMDSRSISLRDLSRIGYVSENQDMPQALTVAEYLDHLRPSIQGGPNMPTHAPAIAPRGCNRGIFLGIKLRPAFSA